MDKILNNLLGIDAKLRILNICEFEFGNNDRYYRNTEEDVNEMLEDINFTPKEVYDTMYLMMYSKSAEIKDFITTEGTSIMFVDEDSINEDFMENIRQNINHPEVKCIVEEELECIEQTILDLLKELN